MELSQLRYFQMAARLEHMTKAADALSVSQPSLSKTIKTLENELNTPLFDRKGKYIKLNASGRLFLEKVNTALAALDEGTQLFKSAAKEKHQLITLAFLAASPVLPELLSEFCREYSNVKFRLLQRIQKQPVFDFDLCISSLPLESEALVHVPLLTEEIFLAVPNSHRLAVLKEINLKEASEEGFISLKQDSGLREITDRFCHRAGFSPHVVFESDDPATVRGLIKAGQGIGFFPSVSWKGTLGDTVSLIKIKEPVCYRTIELSWANNRYQPEIVSKFREFIIRFFSRFAKS